MSESFEKKCKSNKLTLEIIWNRLITRCHHHNLSTFIHNNLKSLNKNIKFSDDLKQCILIHDYLFNNLEKIFNVLNLKKDWIVNDLYAYGQGTSKLDAGSKGDQDPQSIQLPDICNQNLLNVLFYTKDYLENMIIVYEKCVKVKKQVIYDNIKNYMTDDVLNILYDYLFEKYSINCCGFTKYDCDYSMGAYSEYHSKIKFEYCTQPKMRSLIKNIPHDIQLLKIEI